MMDLWIIGKAVLAFFGFMIGAVIYGNRQGRKQEKTKLDSMLLHDIVDAKKDQDSFDSVDNSFKRSWLRTYNRKDDKLSNVAKTAPKK